MWRTLLVVVTVVILALPSAAQNEWPAASAYVGPSYLWLDGESAAGVEVGLDGNLWRHLSLGAEFSWHDFSPGDGRVERLTRFDREDPCGRHPQPERPPCRGPFGFEEHAFEQAPRSPTDGLYLLTSGLRLRHRLGRFQPSAHLSAGWARLRSNNGLGLKAGGGLQFNFTDRWAARCQGGYVRAVGRNGSQLTCGLVVELGPWWGGYRKP